jgi:hypothetical protein
VTKRRPEFGIFEHVLDLGPVPVPVLDRGRALTGGDVKIGHENE